MTFGRPISFFAWTLIVPVDTNPEMADMANPEGHIFGTAALVVAEDADGNRRSIVVGVDRYAENVEPRAEAQAAALTLRLASGRLPVAFERWTAERPAYGSAAYEAYGAADDIAREREEN